VARLALGCGDTRPGDVDARIGIQRAQNGTAASKRFGASSLSNAGGGRKMGRQVSRAPFTCREWARLGRIRAEKRGSGRGRHLAWVIPHAEVLRYQRDGLLPLTANANRLAPTPPIRKPR
jgi:hypothetical protein